MAEKFASPVTVSQPDPSRETVVSATSLLVGRVPPTGSGRVRVGPFGPVINIPTGGNAASTGQVVAGDNAPVAPGASIDIGDKGVSGGLTIRDKSDRPAITLHGESAALVLGTGQGVAGQIMLRSDKNGPVVLATGKTGRITFMDAQLRQTLVIDGVRGDIELIGADCAEDFDVVAEAAPGSVVCIAEDGRLHPCRENYDTRVVGVVSGAGGFRPAVRLDRTSDDEGRQPLALAGKVYCWVDADREPVRMGDLLTTSERLGHAMRATDAARSFGSVIGKSLASLPSGRGLVPVLVGLQ